MTHMSEFLWFELHGNDVNFSPLILVLAEALMVTWDIINYFSLGPHGRERTERECGSQIEI